LIQALASRWIRINPQYEEPGTFILVSQKVSQ